MTVAAAMLTGAPVAALAEGAPPAGGRSAQAATAFVALLAARDRTTAPAPAAPSDSAGRSDDPADIRKDDKSQRHPGDEGEDAGALLAMTGGLVVPAPTSPTPHAPSANAAPAAIPGSAAAPTTKPDSPAAPPAPASSAPAAEPPAAPALASAMTASSAVVAAPAQKASRPAVAKAASALPATSTADALSARVVTLASADRTRAKANGAPDDHSDEAETDTGPASATVPVAPASSAVAPATTAAAPDTSLSAGSALAAGGADRRLDLARGDAWIDGLARDIAATAGSGGTLRFQLSPERLGALQVEVTRGEDGAAVRMTTASAAAQTMLADAKPQLLAQAHSHGIHISQATVDLGGNASGSSSGHAQDGAGQTAGDGASARQQGGSQAGYAAMSGQLGGEARPREQGQPENLYQAGVKDDSSVRESRGGAARDRDAGYA